MKTQLCLMPSSNFKYNKKIEQEDLSDSRVASILN